jgi:hypothetical protein
MFFDMYTYLDKKFVLICTTLALSTKRNQINLHQDWTLDSGATLSMCWE